MYENREIDLVSYEPKYEEAFVKIYQDVYSAEPYCETFSVDDVKKVIGRTRIYLLVDEHCEVLGFVGGMQLPEFYEINPEEANRLKKVIKKPEGVYYIAELGVASQQQRRGLGTKLFEAFLFTIKREGFFVFVLCTASENNNAQGLYERVGFEKLRNEKNNIVYRKVTQQRIDGNEKTDNRPYYILSLVEIAAE